MKSCLTVTFAVLLGLGSARNARALDVDSELVRSTARQVAALESHDVAPLAATLPAAFAISPSAIFESYQVQPRIAAAPAGRSQAFAALATSYVALNALDIYTTTKAIGSGRGVEANPVLGSVAGTPTALTAAKIATTATTLILASRLSKQHRTASVVLLVAANIGMGFVVQHNA